MTDPRVERFAAMVERFPDRSPPRFSLARVLQETGQLQQAADRYGEAARLQPDMMMAWLHRGECLLELGQHEEAEASLMEAMRLAKAQGHEGPQMEIADLLEELEDLRG